MLINAERSVSSPGAVSPIGHLIASFVKNIPAKNY